MMLGGFCDCGCSSCSVQRDLHAPCTYECKERAPRLPDRRRVLGGKSGREIIHIK